MSDAYENIHILGTIQCHMYTHMFKMYVCYVTFLSLYYFSISVKITNFSMNV
jgi:hypothetical protein